MVGYLLILGMGATGDIDVVPVTDSESKWFDETHGMERKMCEIRFTREESICQGWIEVLQFFSGERGSSLPALLPGARRSRSTPPSHPSDTTALIDIKKGLKTYISGGSFGTVTAQMLYGASFDVFPLGRKVAGCMVLAPFSPFKSHKDYTKTMTTASYLAIGPPSQYIPFKLVHLFVSVVLKYKLRTSEKAEAFVRQELFDKMRKLRSRN